MRAVALIVRPITLGWAVQLSDGRELVRFRGPGALRRAQRYVTRITR